MQDDKTEWSLPETNLHVRNNNLIRKSDEANDIFSIPISSINSIKLTSRVSPFGAMIIGSSCALAYIAFYVCESNAATVFIMVLAVLFGGFGLISIVENRIKIKCEDGDFTIAAEDSRDLISGFLISVRRKMKER